MSRVTEVDVHLVQLEDDQCTFARQIAIQAIGKLDPPVLAAALVAVQETSDCDAPAPRSLMAGLARALRDEDWYVRREALQVLAKMGGDALQGNLDVVALLGVEDPDVNVRRAAVLALGEAEPSGLAAVGGVAIVAKQLREKNRGLRLAAVEVLLKIEPAEVTEHVSLLSERIQDPDVEVSRLAADALSRLLHAAAAEGWIAVAEFLVTHHRHALLHARDGANDTPLHVAAREGHLEICQLLVRAGALIKAKNNRRLTPVDLALHSNRTAVFEFLESRKNLTTVRGGNGDAYAPALADLRPIIKVEWYTIPLPGVAGSVGGVHSLLAITVGIPGEPSHTYVIEKAAAIRAGSEGDPEQYFNGVYVSHWLDVAPNISDAPIYCLHAADIEQDLSKGELSMRVLRQIAIDLGPYDVVTCNCHHAALAVYNACAKQEAWVPFIPNSILTATAGILRIVGVDVANSHSQSRSLSSAGDGRYSSIGASRLISQTPEERFANGRELNSSNGSISEAMSAVSQSVRVHDNQPFDQHAEKVSIDLQSATTIVDHPADVEASRCLQLQTVRTHDKRTPDFQSKEILLSGIH